MAPALVLFLMIASWNAPTGAQPAEPVVSDTQTWTTAQPDLTFLPNADTTCDGSPNERYVQPGGVNQPWPQRGSSTQPWATIQFAMRQLRPGETGCVQSGTYTESDLKPHHSGTEAAPIAIVADGAVTVQAPDDNFTFTFDTNAPTPTINYWVVEGFIIDKQQRDRPAIQILGGAGGHAGYIAVRRNVIRNSKASAAVLIRGRATDVLVYDNDIYGHQRWVVNGQTTPVAYTYRSGYGRWDANAVDIQAIQFPGGQPSVQRVRIERNRMRDNGGDGVQCQGGESSGANQPLPGDPADIDLVDNRVVNTPGRNDPAADAIEENAFDIKSCQRVSIRGTDPPDRPGPAATYSKAAEFLPTQAAIDWNGGNNDPGTAIAVHYNARQVRIENTRIWNACQGISVGRDDREVIGLVIRRVLIFAMRFQQGPTPQDQSRCRGRAIQLTNTSQADIYHNTIVENPGTAVRVTRSGGKSSNDIDVWNNVLALRQAPQATPYWVDLGSNVTGFDSDYNLFWHQDDSNPAGAYFRLGTTAMSLATWRQQTPWDRDRPPPAGSTWGDPQWVLNPYANDFFTQPSSPARDAAKPNTGATFCGSAPDIGFRESCT